MLEPEFFIRNIYSLLTDFKTGIIFYPLITYYFHSYFHILTTLATLAIPVFLFAIQYLRQSRRPMIPSWSTEIILITGGAHGVGRSFVETICKKHAGLAKVIILDISEPTYSIPDVFWYKCNVGSRADVADVAERVKKEHGDPTIVVNNAGIVKAKSFVDLTGDEIVSFVVLIMV
jgi:hypothetical protein